MFLEEGKLWVTPGGDPRYVAEEGGFVRTMTLAQAAQASGLGALSAGGFIRFLEGTYRSGAELDVQDTPGLTPGQVPIAAYDFISLYGEPENPIRIQGMGTKTRLVGPGMTTCQFQGTKPTSSDYAFLRFTDCQWVEISGFDVSESWPCFIFLNNCRYVTIRDITARGSQYLIYATGSNCHHIEVKNVSWHQDNTGSLWRNTAWFDVKYGAYKYYNGAIFGSKDILGGVVVRNCETFDSFNAVRMTGKCKETPNCNWNVEITDSRFFRTRDNVVEPEKSARNWWVHGNEVVDCHAWFSLDEVKGGYWYWFNNTGRDLTKPGEPGDPNSGGKVFKFAEGDHPSYPFYIFHNSWWIDLPLAKTGDTANLTHMGNAIDNTRSQNPLVGPTFPQEGPWPSDVIMDGDLCSTPLQERLAAAGQEQRGRFGAGRLFVAPAKGNMRLKAKFRDIMLPGFTMKGGKDWPAPEDWTQPDAPAGAYMDGEFGPAYAHLPWPSEATTPLEMPRISQVRRPKAEGQGFVLYFTVPLTAETVTILLQGARRKAEVPGTISGRTLSFPLPEGWSLEAGKRARIILPQGIVGENTLAATLWACPDPLIGMIPAEVREKLE